MNLVHVSAHPSCKSRVLRIGLAGVVLTCMFGITSAVARDILGPVGNIAIENPSMLAPESDVFGVAVATGDFNGDGVDDLAIADREHPNGVRVYLGKVAAVGAPFASKFQPAEKVIIPVTLGTGTFQSPALAVGNFNSDTNDELVVGVPSDSFNGDSSGAVFVLDRASNGTWSTIFTIRQGGGFPGISDADDHLGASLAVGDFGGDSSMDLAIGIPGEDLSPTIDAGAVIVVYANVTGLHAQGSEAFARGTNGLAGEAQVDEQFGLALAAGDFNDDGKDELAIGIPGASCAGHPNAGSVLVLLGRADSGGLSAAGAAYWNQATPGIADACEDNDRFGTALAAGRFHQALFGEDASAALAIGAPLETVNGVTAAGAVNVIYGGPSGLNAAGNLFLHDGVLPGGTGQASLFGASLSAVHFGSRPDAPDSLIIGAPFATQNGASAGGAIWIVPGATAALDSGSATRLALTPAFAAAPAMAGDAFGTRMAVGDFNGDENPDLAIGIPGHDVDGANNAGAVQVIYQSEFVFVDDFE
ncbi:MAG: FG-GAP repeat protein [Dokdonella sp.]